jgi:hypothetical protein
VHEELERLLAADLDDRDSLPVPALEPGVTGDVDLLELERDVATDALDDAPGALAEVAPLGRVEANEREGYG